MEGSRSLILLFSTLIGFYVLRLWLSGFGGVHPDEAYYWTWSQNLSWGYFDHPPAIAFVIRASHWLVEFLTPRALIESYPTFFALIQLRALPLFLSCVVTPAFIGYAISLMQRRALGFLQIVALLTIPVFVLGPQIVTPDVPFFVCWSLLIVASLHFLKLRGPEAVAGDPTPFAPYLSVVTGCVLAGAAYSKHSAVLAAMLLTMSGLGPLNCILVGITCLILLIPHLLWYSTIGIPQSVGALFQFQNALGGPQTPLRYKSVGDLILGQMALWGPALFWYSIRGSGLGLRRFFRPNRLRIPAGTLSLWTFLPVIFFCLTSLRRPAEANWPLVGVLGGATLVLGRAFFRKRILFWVISWNILISSFAFVLISNPKKLSPLASGFSEKWSQSLEKPSRLLEFSNWDRFHLLIFEATQSKNYPILVQSYQLLSELLFFDRVNPNESISERLKIWPEGSRRSEFNLHERWLPEEKLRTYFLVTQYDANPPSECSRIQDIFKNLEDERPFKIWRCGF